MWITEHATGPTGALNDALMVRAQEGASDGFDSYDVAEVTPPFYYVSLSALIQESPWYLSTATNAPLPTGSLLTEIWDVRVRTDVMDEVSLGFSWDPGDPTYGYDFSDLEAQSLSLSRLVLVDEGTTNGGFVAQYDLLTAGSFDVVKAFGETDTIRYFHIDAELTHVPEPGCWLLIIGGLVCFLRLGRRGLRSR